MKRKEHEHEVNYQSVQIKDEEIDNLIGLEEGEIIKSIVVTPPERNSELWGIRIDTTKTTNKLIQSPKKT